MILRNESGFMATTGVNCDNLLKLQEEISDHLMIFSHEFNSTGEKLQFVLTRIGILETKIQNFNWNVEKPKNIVDELLTNLKDVKGYSRMQTKLVQSFQEKLFRIIDNFEIDDEIISADKSSSSQPMVQHNLPEYEQSYGKSFENIAFEKYENLYDYCLILTAQQSGLHPITNYTELNNLSTKEEPIGSFELPFFSNNSMIKNASINKNQETVLTITNPAVLFPTMNKYSKIQTNVHKMKYYNNAGSLAEENMQMDDAFIKKTITNSANSSLETQSIISTVSSVLRPSSIESKDKFYKNRTIIEDDTYVNR